MNNLFKELTGLGSNSLHLAILNEPYLEYILQGKKTIESRFSLTRVPPYKQVSKGDIVFLKQYGDPIVGLF
jgi:ASC-1-like (ASCH) protein